MKSTSLFLMVMVVFGAMGCSGKASDPAAGGAPAKSAAVQTVSTIHYFEGGGLRAITAPSFSHDLIIDFTNPPGPLIQAQDPSNTSCLKSGSLTAAQQSQLFDLISKLVLVKAGPLLIADAGVEWIEVTTTDSVKYKYYLNSTAPPQGELVAVDGSALSTFLQTLESSLVTSCTIADVPAVPTPVP